MMKYLMCALGFILSAALAACAGSNHVVRNDYFGDSSHWPVGNGFGRTLDGVVIIETGLPNKPYEVLALVDIPVKSTFDCPAGYTNLTEDAAGPACWDFYAAREAKRSGADAVLVLSESIAGEKVIATAFPHAFGAMVTASRQKQKRKNALLIRWTP